MKVDLTVIIVSWNTATILCRCLNALHTNIGGLSTQIIVIDNASQDGSAEMIEKHFPQVQLIRNQDNVGFSKANNQGITQARGRYVLLLNSDALVQPETLSFLLQFMETHREIGACSPRLRMQSGDAQAYAFGDDPSLAYLLRRGLSRLFLNRPIHNWDVPYPIATDWVSGACLLLRREVVEQIEGFDESFFMYFEDADLCLRIRQHGWQIFYVPQVDVIHLGGQSLRQNPKAQRAYQQSLIYFYTKHYSALAYYLLITFLATYNLLSAFKHKWAESGFTREQRL